MKICAILVLVVGATVCNIEQASALRGNGIRASDLHRIERIATRRILKKGTSGKEPYEIVAEHEGGLFGSVKKVAKKAKDKQEAVAAAAVEATNTTSNATSAPTGVPANETLPRDLPMFSLQFYTTSDFNPTDDLSNYDELETYLGQYLGDRMDEVFKDSPGEHLFTEVYVDETADPFIVDVYATANFKIPGQVPKDEYLVEQTKEAFTVQEDPDEYVNDFDYLIKFLRTMNTTNPFHKTVDIVYEPWAKIFTTNTSNHSSYWASVFSLLGIAAFLSLAIILAYVFKKHRESQFILHDDPLHLHVVEPRSGINGMSYSDEESLRHVDAVRKQYSDSNNLPQISLFKDRPQDHQLEPAGSYEAPIFIGYKDEVEEEEEEESDSEGSGEYIEKVIEEDEESVEETIEEEFTDEPQQGPEESNLSRFERLLGNVQGTDSDDEETVEEEIIEDEDEEESSYDEQTVDSGDLLGLASVPIKLQTESSEPVDPPQEEPEVATKDLFSMWENKLAIAPVDSLNDKEESKSPAAPSADPPAQRNGLFSFWAIKAGESKDDVEDDEESADEEVVTETEEQTDQSNDDEPTEHTLV